MSWTLHYTLTDSNNYFLAKTKCWLSQWNRVTNERILWRTNDRLTTAQNVSEIKVIEVKTSPLYNKILEAWTRVSRKSQRIVSMKSFKVDYTCSLVSHKDLRAHNSFFIFRQQRVFFVLYFKQSTAAWGNICVLFQSYLEPVFLSRRCTEHYYYTEEIHYWSTLSAMSKLNNL